MISQYPFDRFHNACVVPCGSNGHDFVELRNSTDPELSQRTMRRPRVRWRLLVETSFVFLYLFFPRVRTGLRLLRPKILLNLENWYALSIGCNTLSIYKHFIHVIKSSKNYCNRTYIIQAYFWNYEKYLLLMVVHYLVQKIIPKYIFYITKKMTFSWCSIT